MAVFVSWTSSSTILGSEESSSDRSIVCSLAQSRSSLVGSGGLHFGTSGFPTVDGGLNDVDIMAYVIALQDDGVCDSKKPVKSAE